MKKLPEEKPMRIIEAFLLGKGLFKPFPLCEKLILRGEPCVNPGSGNVIDAADALKELVVVELVTRTDVAKYVGYLYEWE